MADVLAELDDDPQNAEAWAMFHRVVTRFSVDTHTAGVMLTHELTEKTQEEILDLFARFTLLYDILHPPPEPK